MRQFMPFFQKNLELEIIVTQDSEKHSSLRSSETTNFVCVWRAAVNLEEKRENKI